MTIHIQNGQKSHRSVRGTFDGHLAFKGFGTLVQCIEIPIDPQDILDGNIPFDALVLKPQSAAFDEFGMLAFVEQNTSKIVVVVLTDTNIETNVPIGPIPDDGPGMWVLIIDPSSDPIQIEQAIRVTDGTNILIPEVHLAELTGVFGDVVESGSTILADSALWADCLPFARFCYTTVLPLPQSAYDALQPQLTEELPIGALVAVIE